jgi:hypothetical protein
VAVDIQCVLERIPAMDRFPAMDEVQAEQRRLAEHYPDLVRLQRIGTSRQGEPILMATIGTGTRHALVFGGPHPDEPVGFLTVQELGRLLCADVGLRQALGYCWHLIPCVDPDGARRNEGWYRHPDSRELYGRSSYRPAGDEQVEWTFPYQEEPGYFDRMLPETMALARVIDGLAPTLQCSLHNGEYGGVFHYVSTDDRALADRLAAVPGWQGLPLHSAVWEVPASNVITPGVLLAPTTRQLAAMAVAAGVAPTTGASSADYARPHGTLTVVSEVPRWGDPRSADTTACGRDLDTVIGSSLQIWDDSVRKMHELLAGPDRDLVLDTPYRRSLKDGMRIGDSLASGWRALLSDPTIAGRPATVAEECSFEVLPRMLRLRLAGAALRALDSEVATGNVRRSIRRAHVQGEQLFRSWLQEADASLPGEHIELRRLVAVQIGSVLTAAEHARQLSAEHGRSPAEN